VSYLRNAFRELVAAIGRGGGKDSVISFLVTYLAPTFDPREKLRPGERVYVLCIAVDKAQAKICYDYIRGYFEHIPALASLVSNIGSSSIELTNSVTIEVSVANFRSVRGRSILVAVLDEAAFSAMKLMQTLI
jgi:phage terminase large subunit-like protein